MKRRLLRSFHLAAALSLLLCVATVVLWVRSYSVSDAITCGNDNVKYGVQSASGSIVLVTATLPSAPRAVKADPSLRFDDNSAESFVRWTGLNYARTNVPFTSPRTQSLPDVVYPLASTSLVVPFWPLVAVLAIAPICYLFNARRNRWL